MVIAITKSAVKEILKDAGKKVKAAEAGEELTPRGDLLSETVEKKKVKIKDKTTTVAAPDGTSVQISKSDFKTKVPKPDQRADDALDSLSSTKITQSILSDFNIDNIQNADDIAQYIKKYLKNLKKNLINKNEAYKLIRLQNNLQHY